MKPDENSSSKGGTPLSTQRSILASPENQDKNQEAAVQIIRHKIDNLFSNKTEIAEDPKIQKTDENPYDRTHSDAESLKTDDWKKYHTAWQEYYQKYYEGYYTHHLNKAKESIKNEPISKNEAESQLKNQLVDKIKSSSEKVRKSRHFIPILCGVFVVLFFLFLQYNTLITGIATAYVSPGHINPQNLVVDPETDIAVSPEPRLIIPKINVDVPVYYDISNDYDSLMAAMDKGVAHFAIPGASSHPGQVGNTVISGHSSNDIFTPGDYKFIFAQLERLNVGDTIYANYNSKRYTYTVTKKQVVGPKDVSQLVYPTTKPILTLITCVPVGTANSRLLVTAEQVSPDPSQSSAAPKASNTETKKMPGNSKTLLEQLFSLGG